MDAISFEVKRTFAAPPEALWAVIGDYARDGEWREGVQMRQEPPGMAVQGATTYEQLRFLGQTHVVVATLESVEPGRAIVFRTTESDVPTHGERRIEPTRDGCTVTVRIALTPTGVWRVVAHPMAALLRRRFERDLERLATLVEAPASRAA